MNTKVPEGTDEKLERVRSYFRGDLLVLRETLLRMASLAHNNLSLALESLVWSLRLAGVFQLLVFQRKTL